MKSLSLYLRLFLLYVLPVFVSLPAFSQTTGFSGTGANIDVTYQRCEWRINPDSASKGIKGVVTTYFETKVNNVSTITFDLNKASFNNASLSVKYHGSNVSFSFPASGAVNIITITLPSALAINTFDSLTINYNGVPPAVSGQAEGYQKKIGGGANYIYTLSESYEDRDWWPCKADMQDKIDSMDIYMNVPNSFTAVSLGRLIDSSITGADQVFHWKTNHPTASYLVAVGVAKYRVYDRGTVNINGTNVPVWYFLFPGKTAGTYTSILTALDDSKLELTAFSNVFGDYAFKDEKHGYYEFGWGGGMEHQSMSAMGNGVLTDWGTIAHELGHQWFGDKVTFGTWNDLWLAEGFARYCEALAAELVPTLGQNPATVRSGFKSTTNNVTYRAYGCYIPNGSITSSDVMWSSVYGTTVYERGAMVVSMLRMLLGDAKFYQACQNYMNDPALAYRSATTDDLRNHMQAVAGGYDLTAFFDSYVYGNGYPSYNTSIKWGNPGGNRINFKVTTQTKSTGSTVTYYHTPIALRVRGSLASEDTVLVIYDQNGQLSRGGNGISTPIAGSYISFMLGFTPVTVTFDPFSQTLAAGVAPAFDGADPLLNFSTLPVNVIDFTLKENNFNNELKLSLSDINGELKKVILQKSSNGVDFTDAGEMEEKQAGSAGVRNYQYTDYNPYAVVYYRTRIVEVNSVKYSSIVKSNRSLSSAVSVYPNPAQKEVTIRWTDFTVSGGEAEVKIISMDGRQVWSKTTSAGFVNLSVAAFPAGAYMIHVKQNEKIIFNRQLMITK